MTNEKWKIFFLLCPQASFTLGLGGLGDFPRLNAASAYLHAFGAALRQLDPDGLQVRIEATWGSIVCMRNVIAELGRFSAYFAAFSHD